MTQALISPPLGVSLPPQDIHALSVSMPKWKHVVGYEEADPAVLTAMACGYPRFFRHPLVEELVAYIKATQFTSDDAAEWDLLPTPIEATAARLQVFLASNSKGNDASVTVHHIQGLLWVVRFPKELAPYTKQFWQHTGEIVSSRHVEQVLAALKNPSEQPQAIVMKDSLTHQALQQRIASLYFGESASKAEGRSSDVSLYPTGMGAMFAAVRLLSSLRSEAKSIMIGFPYVDSLKILQRPEWCKNGVYFFPVCGEKEMEEVEAILAREPIMGVFNEFPGNPLLSTPDLTRLAKHAHANGTTLVVDDTVGSYNLNTMKHQSAGIVVTSLSKIFSGTCNIMGGSLVLNPSDPLYTQLKATLSPEDSFIVEADAKVLLDTSIDLMARVARVNANTSIIANRLKGHPLVKDIYYPEFMDTTHFNRFLTDSKEMDASPRFGPLFSVLLKGGLPVAQSFYDAVGIAKGPSLGTNFTICCPYTLLAHYNELEFVESCGVDRNLLRFSIGLEDPETIWTAFADALAVAEKVYTSSNA